MTTLQRFQARVIAETNINISVTGVGVAVQGVTLAVGDEVLLNGQTTQQENGYYVLSATAPFWTRVAEFDEAAEMKRGTEFYVREGNVDNAGSAWTFDVGAPITVGVTALDFKRESYGPGAAPTGEGLDRDPATNQWGLEDQFTPEGYFTRVQTDSFGRVQDAVESAINTTFIEGLELEYVSGTALTVGEGSAYVLDEGQAIDLAPDEDITGLVLSANSWYYFYLYEAGGEGAVEWAIQAPVTFPYRGAARIKGPDSPADGTRRYLRAVRTDGSGNIRRFEWRDNKLLYLADTTVAPFRVLDDGRATTYTTVSCAALVPPTSTRAVLRLVSRSGSFPAELTNSSVGTVITTATTNSSFVLDFPLDGSQALQYRYSGGAPAAGNGLHIDVVGYVEERD